MKLQLVKTLYFYEVPTLILCQDASEASYLFVLLDEDAQTYIGKATGAEDLSQFLNGKADLRTMMEHGAAALYIASFTDSNSLEAQLYKGILSEDILPEPGLTLIPPEPALAASVQVKATRRLTEGSAASLVGQIERKTQNRVVKLFQEVLGYRYLGNWQDREGNSNVEASILKDWLTAKRSLSPALADKAIAELTRATIASGNLYDTNKIVYNLLRYGVSVRPAPGENKVTVPLVDWNEPLNNDFAIAEEVTIDGRYYTKRPDIVLYVNGVAFGVLELKRSTVSISEGIRQSYANQQHIFIAPFFATVQYVMAGADIEGIAYGTTLTKEKYFLTWKEVTESGLKQFPWLATPTAAVRELSAKHAYPLDKHLIQLLSKERFIEGIRDFLVFDRGTKKLFRHNQYFGTKAAQDFVQRGEGGIIWHTQGSGKSLTMVWLAKWIRGYNPNARVLIITDREELDDQIQKVFVGAEEKDIYRTSSGGNLLAKLNDTTPWLMCSLIHKFGGKDSPEADEADVDNYIANLSGAIPKDYSPKGDIYVFVDECHRTQSGKLHDAMKRFIPGALFYGFTGTPLLAADKKNSRQLFGDYIHTYKFNEAVADKVVLDLRYEARDVEQTITSPERIDQWFELKTRGLTDYAKAELKARWGTMKRIFSSRSRLEKIVLDVMLDMERKERLQNGHGNAILVSDSILNACRYYQLFQDAGLKECAIVTSYAPNYRDLRTAIAGEGKTEAELRYNIYSGMLAEHFGEPRDTAVNKVEQFEKEVKERFIKEPARMKLLVVVNKLLTGFDAPSATYLYIDKQLRDHGLFQAVCRVNRLDGEDKDYGYIIDYKDLFKSLEQAYHDFTAEAFNGYAQEDIDGLLKDRRIKGVERLEDALEAIKALCEPVEQPKGDLQFVHYFCGNTEYPDDLKDTEPRRVMLYKLTLELLRAYGSIADELLDTGYTEAQVEAVKEDIRQFEAVRKVVQIASRDYIDLKQYEPAMRHLIDSYIGAEDSRVLGNLGDLSLVELLIEKGKDALNDLPDGLRDNPDAMAEAIENNVRKVIIEESLKNPMYYESMSVLLDELIKRRRQGTIKYAQYLTDIINLSGKVKKPTADIYPAVLNTAALRALYDNTGKGEEIAIDLDVAIKASAKDGWKTPGLKRKAVQNAIAAAFKKHGIEDKELVERTLNLAANQHEY